MDANVPVLPNTKSLWLVLLVAVLRSEEGLTLPTKHTMARIDKNVQRLSKAYFCTKVASQLTDLLALLQIRILQLNLPADHNTDSRVKGIL